MKSKTKIPKFDAEGYQAGEPHLMGEPLAFDGMRVLTKADELAMGLPSPDELADNAPRTKITLTVDDDALAFFKEEAKRQKTSYQRMIRNLVSAYAKAHGKP